MRRAHDINEQRRVRYGMAVLLGCTFERYPDTEHHTYSHVWLSALLEEMHGEGA